jgi:hypothetical protein
MYVAGGGNLHAAPLNLAVCGSMSLPSQNCRRNYIDQSELNKRRVVTGQHATSVTRSRNSLGIPTDLNHAMGNYWHVIWKCELLHGEVAREIY